MFALKPISEKLVYSTHKHMYKHILHTDIYRHTHTHINTHMTGTELESGKWI